MMSTTFYQYGDVCITVAPALLMYYANLHLCLAAQSSPLALVTCAHCMHASISLSKIAASDRGEVYSDQSSIMCVASHLLSQLQLSSSVDPRAHTEGLRTRHVSLPNFNRHKCVPCHCQLPFDLIE